MISGIINQYEQLITEVNMTSKAQMLHPGIDPKYNWVLQGLNAPPANTPPPITRGPLATQTTAVKTTTAATPIIQEISHLYQPSLAETIRTIAGATLGYAFFNSTLGTVAGAVGGYFLPYIATKLSQLTQTQPVKTLQPADREMRVRTGATKIQSKLATALRRANDQMSKECDKTFQYQSDNNTLPNKVKAGKVGQYSVGLCHAQGRRPTMEDEHLAAEFRVDIQGKIYTIPLFGVFDGHGGNFVSRFVATHLQAELSAALKKYNPNGLTDEGIWNALKMACVSLDKQIDPILKAQGSTGTFAMILDGKIWTANVGDSRTIIDNGGTPVQLTEDAKPDDPNYAKGIGNRNGVVIDGLPPRVNGILAVARAFGDHGLNGAVSARPKITALPLRNIRPGSHLVLCCDGVWDVASTRQVARAVHLHSYQTPEVLAKNIVYSAFAAGSTDNLSAMVIRLP